MTGTLRVVATRRGARTVVDTLRQEGLARCSRPFALPSGGARIVTMQLGPGYLRGDRFSCAGSVGARAELAVTAQAATRALGRGDESLATAAWQVAAGGTLRLLGEPLVLYPNARHRATVEVELGSGATLTYLDVIAASATFASVATRLRVHAGKRLLLHDALVLTPERFDGAVGSAFFLRAGDAPQSGTPALAAADAAANRAMRLYDVRVGVGQPACGGVSVRALGRGAANVQTALRDVLDAIVANVCAGDTETSQR